MRRELGQAEPREPERRAPIARNLAHEVVRRATRRADDEGFGGDWKLLKKEARGCEPCRRGCGRDDSNHSDGVILTCSVFVFTSNFSVLTSYFLLAAVLQPSALAAFETRLGADPENLRLGAQYREAVIAAEDYDRAIKFLDGLAARPGAGPHAFLNLGLAYIDKIPSVGALRRISIGNNATSALTHAIEREPSDVAYLIRGLVNLHFERGVFHRTPEGVADLENALRLAAAHAGRPYVARIYVALGDGYWRLSNHEKARATWRDGQAKFSGDERIRLRLTSADGVVSDTIAHDLDGGIRVDTSLRDVIAD
jgi:tetratricopeptide (TPR) repeat protein